MAKSFSMVVAAGALASFFLWEAGSVCAGEGAMRTFTKSDDKRSVDISLGQDFSIGLPAQMGTGYVWKVTKLPAGITQTGEDMTGGDDSQRLGRTEQKIFRFKAISADGGHIVVTYARPWETSTPPAEVFDLDVNVTP